MAKFRAWDKERQSMRTSKQMMVTFDGEIYPNDQDSFYPRRFILMQFTGLLDKNGKEIYEGDIVQDIHEEYGENLAGLGGKKTLVKAEVKWEAPEFLAMYKVPGGLWNMLSLPDQCEIIGNIHQSPELLTS